MPPAGTQISAVVGLTILEVMRSQDRPDEVLEDENLSITLPRRLGLNDVVDSRIRFYEEAARKKTRVQEAEIRDLVALVARRPDSGEVFRGVGRTLAGQVSARRAYRRLLRKGFLGSRSRNRLGKALGRLIGRRVGRFEKGSFTFVSDDPFFLGSNTGDDVCNLVSGFLEAALSKYANERVEVTYGREAGLDGTQYRWTIRDRAEELDGSGIERSEEDGE